MGKMCRVVVSTHSYSGCRLELLGSEPAAAEVNNPLPKSLLQQFATSLNLNTTNASTPPAPLKEVESTSSSSTHVVKRTDIMQCQTAFEDTTQTGREQNDRRCAVLTPFVVLGGVEPEAVGEPGPTEVRATCPVCKAAEEAVSRALRQEQVTPFEPKLKPATPGRETRRSGTKYRDGRPVDGHYSKSNGRHSARKTKRHHSGCRIM